MSARFQSDWLSDPNLNFWIEEVKDDPKKAKCKLCNLSFSLSNMGRTAVNSHAKGIKHKKRVEGTQISSPLNIFFKSTNTSASNDNQIDRVEAPVINSQQSKVNSFLLKGEVSSAEILWCIQTLIHHKSMRSAASDVLLFKTMFQDSDIARKMELQRTKIAYSVLYGIAPFFKEKLTGQIKSCEYFVIGFDEALNKICQQTQMDLNIRYWNAEKSEVSTRYLTSAFLERSRAIDLVAAFKEALAPILSLKKIIQISMDGPNVNLKFLKDLNSDLLSDYTEDKKMLSMGCCGLHKMHGAFKGGIQATGWNVVEFLRALYYLFKDVPLRRAQLTEYSGSTTFPKKFCAVRWLENDGVAARAIEVIPNIIKMVEGLKLDKKEPTSSSYQTVSEAISDPLLPVKLEFFRSLSAEANQFLREFQTDAPMAPFVYNDMMSILENVLKRFVKKEVIESSKSLTNIDLNEKSNLLPCSDIDLGYGTRKALRRENTKKKIPDSKINNFRQDVMKAFKTFVEKLSSKSPLQYRLTKAVSVFDPSLVSSPNIRDNRLKLLLSILTENNWISGIIAEKTERDFKKLFSDPLVQEKCKSFSRSSFRLDHFWRDVISCSHLNRPTLMNVVKMAMVLSHGNSNIERGFSVNSECLVENLHNETLIAQRVVYDSIRDEVNGDVPSFKVPKELILSYRNARMRLTEEMEKRKREAAVAESESSKRKRIESEKKELASKKAKLMAEIHAINEHVGNLK